MVTSPEAVSAFDQLNVLFVDSAPDERELFEARFGKRCARLVTVDTACDAFAELADGTTDLLIADAVLPDIGGPDFIRRLRVRPPEAGGTVPAIVATGWVGLQLEATLLAAGFSGFIAKPYTTDEIDSVVAAITPSIARLRFRRALLARQRVDLRALRERLVERQAAIRRQRVRLLLKYGRDEERIGAKRLLVKMEAKTFAATYLGEARECSIVGHILEDRRESWIVRVAGHEGSIFVELVTSADDTFTVRSVDSGVCMRISER